MYWSKGSRWAIWVGPKGTPRGKWHGVSKAIKKSSQGGACLSPGSDRCCGVARASQVTLVEKNLPANPRDIRYTGLIPGLGRSPEGGHSNPLQYSCLENLMDRGAWQATVLGSQRVRHNKRLSTHTHRIAKSLKIDRERFSFLPYSPQTALWHLHSFPIDGAPGNAQNTSFQ